MSPLTDEACETLLKILREYGLTYTLAGLASRCDLLAAQAEESGETTKYEFWRTQAPKVYALSDAVYTTEYYSFPLKGPSR